MLKTYNIGAEKRIFINWKKVLEKHKKNGDEKIVRNIADGETNILYELRNHIVMGTASFPLSKNFYHVAFVRNVNSKNGKRMVIYDNTEPYFLDELQNGYESRYDVKFKKPPIIDFAIIDREGWDKYVKFKKSIKVNEDERINLVDEGENESNKSKDIRVQEPVIIDLTSEEESKQKRKKTAAEYKCKKGWKQCKKGQNAGWCLREVSKCELNAELNGFRRLKCKLGGKGEKCDNVCALRKNIMKNVSQMPKRRRRRKY